MMAGIHTLIVNRHTQRSKLVQHSLDCSSDIRAGKFRIVTSSDEQKTVRITNNRRKDYPRAQKLPWQLPFYYKPTFATLLLVANRILWTEFPRVIIVDNINSKDTLMDKEGIQYRTKMEPTLEQVRKDWVKNRTVFLRFERTQKIAMNRKRRDEF